MRRPRLEANVWQFMTESAARKLWTDFQASTQSVTTFCRTRRFNGIHFARTMQRFFPEEWTAVIAARRPAGRRYKLGRDLEYRVRDRLEACGYLAFRSPGSKSPIDVVGLKVDFPMVLVQCKRDGAITNEEWNALWDLAVKFKAIPVMAEQPVGTRNKLQFYRLVNRRDTDHTPRWKDMERWAPLLEKGELF